MMQGPKLRMDIGKEMNVYGVVIQGGLYCGSASPVTESLNYTVRTRQSKRDNWVPIAETFTAGVLSEMEMKYNYFKQKVRAQYVEIF